MKALLRQLYRQLILIISWCLLITALTGIIAGLNGSLLQLPNRVVEILISLHQGAFLGDKIAPIYVLLLGLGIFFLGLKVIVEGRYNLLFQSLPPAIANVCRWIVLILLIPLAICVETGVAYRLGTDWFGMSSSETAAFLSVHGGSFSQQLLGFFYLLAATATLITILILNKKRNRIPQKKIVRTLQRQFKTDSAPSSLTSKVLLRRLIITCVSIALLGILYYTTSALLVAIAIMAVVTIFSLVILYRKLVKDWQQQKSTRTIAHEQEAESITILKAIPDSMLRISQNGVCLSYMPAKEATSFVLDGNIVNQHISEFLAPEIAGQFMASTRSSLQTGSTNICRFPISVDKKEQYYEARTTPIGESEVLILVREIASVDGMFVGQQQQISQKNTQLLKILTESEFIQVLETTLSDDEDRNHILLCLTMDGETNDNNTFTIDDNLISEIAAHINFLFPSSTISRIDHHNLIILVSDRTMETISASVDDLHHNLKELMAIWQTNSQLLKFNIAMLEINADNSDAAALIDAAVVACQMAKRKINFKTFW